MLNRVIEPGEILEEAADIGRLYDMSRPGEYNISSIETRFVSAVKREDTGSGRIAMRAEFCSVVADNCAFSR